MDIQETISRVRKEYKDYLREKHPDWAESSLSTHVSDAFYLYQHTIALSFWKCFESDESMAAAKQDILEYLKHDVMSERAEERTAGYFNDLKMLKEFLDEMCIRDRCSRLSKTSRTTSGSNRFMMPI